MLEPDALRPRPRQPRASRRPASRYGYTSRETVLRLGEHLRLTRSCAASDDEYTYEREVEEFLRWSPHVRRNRERRRRRGAARGQPTARSNRTWLQTRLQGPVSRRARPALSYTFALWDAELQISRLSWRARAADRGGRRRVRLGLARRQRQIADGITHRRRRRRRHEPRRRRAKSSSTGARRPARASRSPSGSRACATCSSPKKLEVSADIDGDGRRAPTRQPDGGLPTRVWRYVTGGDVDENHRPTSPTPSRRDRRVRRRGRRRGRPRPDRRVRRADRGARSTRRRQGRRQRSTRSKLDRTMLVPSSARASAGASSRRPSSDEGPPMTTDGPRDEVPGLSHGRSLELHAQALEEPEAGQDLPGRDRRRRASTRRPGSTTSRTSGQSRPGPCPTRAWAGDLAGQGDPRRVPENPLKARWMGIFDGAGIHGTDEDALDRQRGLARLRAHARSPTSIDLYTGSPSGLRSTSARRPGPLAGAGVAERVARKPGMNR